MAFDQSRHGRSEASQQEGEEENATQAKVAANSPSRPIYTFSGRVQRPKGGYQGERGTIRRLCHFGRFLTAQAY
jgi:hypothetical protein